MLTENNDLIEQLFFDYCKTKIRRIVAFFINIALLKDRKDNEFLKADIVDALMC